MSCHPGACTVFQAAQETDSERSEGEHKDIQDGIYQDTHLCFKPDAKSDSADSCEGDGLSSLELGSSAITWRCCEGLLDPWCECNTSKRSPSCD